MKTPRKWGFTLLVVLLSGLVPLIASGQDADAPPATAAEDILAAAEQIVNPDPGFQVELRVQDDKTTFTEGDTVSFVANVDKPCHLTLIDIGTSGKITIIFPNEWHAESMIEPGKDYVVPPADANFRFRLVGPVDQLEVVKAIASLEPIQAIQNAELEGKGPLKVLRKPGLVIKDIVAEMGARDAKDWATAEVAFMVQAKE